MIIESSNNFRTAKTFGNTAQVPPCGLSTAPAATARHLRCQNARQDIQYYLRFWLSICRTSLAVSALRIMRYCLKNNAGVRVVQAHSNRPAIPIGDFSLLIIPLPLYLPIKNAPSPIFLSRAQRRRSTFIILYYLFFFNFPVLTTVNTSPSTLNFTSTPPKLRPYRRSGSCW